MSRSGYSDDGDFDNWSQIKWRGQVTSAIRGRRGQAFLREMLEALDAMPNKRLIAHELRQGDEVCAIGCVGARRGIDLEALDPENYGDIANTFGIAKPLVQQIEYENDDPFAWREISPEQRWQKVRDWVTAQIKP